MRILSCLFVLFSAVAFAQTKQLDSLSRNLRTARTPVQQVQAYFDLATKLMERNRTQADSLAFVGITIAESTRDRSVMMKAYLLDAGRQMRSAQQTDRVEQARSQALHALALANENNNVFYAVAAKNFIARSYRMSTDAAHAIQASNEAASLVNDVANDSLKVMTYLGLGLSLNVKNDMINVFKAYLNALNVAEKSQRTDLLKLCYERLIDFYQTLKNYERAKDYAFKILHLDEKSRKRELLMDDYFKIASVYAAAKEIPMALHYYSKTSRLADSLKYQDFKIEIKLAIVNMYINSNHFREGYELIRKTPEITEFIHRLGMDYELDRANGYLQQMLKHYDSSNYYYLRAEKHFKSEALPIQRYYFYAQFSELMKVTKKWDLAIDYQLKAKQAIDQSGNLEHLSETLRALDTLYIAKGDFSTAYKYHEQYQTVRDSLQKLSKEKDLQSLEIENENKRKERELAQAEEELRRSHNLQYMAITVAIGGIFILLVAIGLLKVSTTVVKAMGFFAFIFLFEFIILIADHRIHEFTHGEPWKVLLIKIFLVALLLPLHHWLEEKVIHYLITNRAKLAGHLKKIIPTAPSGSSEED